MTILAPNIKSRRFQSSHFLLFELRSGQRYETWDKDAALNRDDGHPLGRETLREVADGHVGPESIPAGKNVHSGVTILRPRVDREVGLADDDDPADPEETKSRLSR